MSDHPLDRYSGETRDSRLKWIAEVLLGIRTELLNGRLDRDDEVRRYAKSINEAVYKYKVLARDPKTPDSILFRIADHASWDADHLLFDAVGTITHAGAKVALREYLTLIPEFLALPWDEPPTGDEDIPYGKRVNLHLKPERLDTHEQVITALLAEPYNGYPDEDSDEPPDDEDDEL